MALELRNRETLPPTVLEELDNLVAQLDVYLSQTTTAPTVGAVTGESSEVPLGSIVLWPSATTPTNWLICDGTAYSRVIYANLFRTIGTTFGAGDGSTTFNLPDLRQKFPLGKSASGTGSTLGSTGGAIDHTHSFSATSGAPSATTNITVGATAVASAAHTHSVSGTTGTQNPPFLTLNFIILAR